MAAFQILYWQELPSQIKVIEGSEELNRELPPKYQEKIDQTAGERGLIGSDAYLEGWQWGELVQREGSAQDVLREVEEEIEKGAQL